MLYGYVIYSPYCIYANRCNGVYIHVWASALLVSTRMGNARRPKRGTGDKYSNPHFFYMY